MSGILGRPLADALARGSEHNFAGLAACAQKVLVWTSGSLTTLLVHEWLGRHAACDGAYCWPCARGSRPITAGFGSALLIYPRRPAQAPLHLVVTLMGEPLCQAVLALADRLDSLRGSACHARSAQRIDRWDGARAEEDPLPAALDPLVGLLPLYGHHARYGVWGPSIRVEIPTEHLPRPEPRWGLAHDPREEG